MDAIASGMIRKARKDMLLENPFFGSLAMRLQIANGVDRGIDTMATDGKHIFYNPSFVMSYDIAQIKGVVAHEVLHCTNLHQVRMQGRDSKVWNIACDYAINLDLVKSKFTLPDCALLDKKYKDMNAERIYETLKQEYQSKPIPQAVLDGLIGDVVSPCGADGKTPMPQTEAMSEQKATWKAAVAQAANVAKRAGKLGSNEKRLAKRITETKVDWRDVLRRFVDDKINVDYTWSRPNRRFIHQGLILPGTVASGVGHLVCFVDTSASVDEKALGRFQAELQAMLDGGNVQKVTISCADTTVKGTQEFNSGDVVDIKIRGGGGTAFAHAFHTYARGDYGQASAVLYFTDLCVYDQAEWVEPDCPTLFLVYGPDSWNQWRPDDLPFGEQVKTD